MSNTIRIKRSSVTATPASLAFGELAFGANGELFIGDANGSVVKIGSINVATTGNVATAKSEAITAANGYTDTAIAALTSATNGSVADLQAQINAEVARATAAEAAAEAAAKAYADQKVADLVASAPAVLDTLNELAAALGNDPSFATTVANQIGTVDAKVVAETARATAAEADLQAAIDAEAARAAAAEATLQSNIDDLATQAQTAISDEESARIAGDAAVNARIDALTAAQVAYNAAEGTEWDPLTGTPVTVKGALDQLNAFIVGTREEFETAISAEEAARIAADQNLQSQINALSSQTQGAIDGLTGADILYADSTLNVLFDYRLTGPNLQDETSDGVVKSYSVTDAVDALAREISLVYSEIRQAGSDNGQVLKSMATQSASNVAITGGSVSNVTLVNAVMDGGEF